MNLYPIAIAYDPATFTRMTRFFIIVFVIGMSAFTWADELVPALRQDNRRELLRLGSERGAQGLAKDILGPDRPLAIAAIRASLGARDSWALLGELGEAARRPDRSVAVLAVEAAAEIAQLTNEMILEQGEVRDEQLLDWYNSFLLIAFDSRRWVDIRIYAFETATRLHELVSPDKRPPLNLTSLLAEEEAELRAAVLSLAPAHLDVQGQALALLGSDPSDLVALAAGQVVCGPLGFSKPIPNLDDQAAARTLHLAKDASLEIAARADLAPCLATIDSPESLRVLAQLRQQSPPMLRKSLSELRAL